MTRTGNRIKFDHVRHDQAEGTKGTLFIVKFDGEPELWWLESESTAEQGLAELTEYYLEDWAGTGRTLPVAVYREEFSFAIDCKTKVMPDANKM